MAQNLLTPREAAASLRMSYRACLNYIKAGLLKTIRINRRKFLIRQSEIDRFLGTHER